jgi:transposase
MQCEEDWLVMHTLYTAHGWSIARLAREFGVNWRTARRYATAEVPPGYGPRPCPAGLTEAQLAHVRRRLELCPELRATTLFREVGELGYAGSYPSFARRVRALRPGGNEVDPPLRFETGPGVQAQGDWAHCGRWLLGEGLVELHALVVVLGCSRMVAVRFATDTTRTTTLGLLPWVLADLGGAPTELLTDRDPAFVVGETPGHRPVFAPEWVDLSGRLGLTPKACRPYRAKTKGKVERVIRELKEDFLRWLTGQVLPAPALDRRLRPPRQTLVHRGRGRTPAPDHRPGRGRGVGRGAPSAAGDPPARLLAEPLGAAAAPAVVDLAELRRAGDQVEARSLTDYEAVL